MGSAVLGFAAVIGQRHRCLDAIVARSVVVARIEQDPLPGLARMLGDAAAVF